MGLMTCAVAVRDESGACGALRSSRGAACASHIVVACACAVLYTRVCCAYNNLNNCMLPVYTPRNHTTADTTSAATSMRMTADRRCE